MADSEKKPGFSYPKMRSLNQETGFLMCLAQICGEFREETRFLMSQEKRDRFNVCAKMKLLLSKLNLR
ncbi:hypothetical protein [Planktothricoides sp. SR001]|uniref:hypothetical protein n=1 Tax=Planktothricoides sp. SR001 TaxID=1705388 RepID=UPI0012E1DDC6|nr:hypothetical protein [Planktothricoides sp. SR001]